MIKHIFAVTPALALLGACASPTPPSISASDIAAAQAEINRIEDLPDATTADLPVNQAAYTGKFAGNLIIDGESGYSMLGDMSLDVDYGLFGAVSGTVGNINLLEDGVLDQRLGGSLDIGAGSRTGTEITATASGTISAVPDDIGIRQSTEVEFDMTGDHKLEGDGSTSLIGTWSGGDTGVFTNDFDVSGSGNFFATAD